MTRIRALLVLAAVVGRVTALAVRNRLSRSSVTGDVDVCLSMTTFGARTDTVYIAIESIVSSSARPRTLVLWLDEKDRLDDLPKSLIRLGSRGLDIRFTENYGPHKKLYSAALTAPKHDRPVVTCDDDVLYPRRWLADLVSGYESQPHFVTGFRARVITFDGPSIASYRNWPICASAAPSFRHVLTNVSGNIYPPAFVDIVRDAGEEFMTVSPSADDLWLHHLAIRTGYRIRQINATHRQLQVIPGSQKASLFDHNVAGGENDRIVARLYTDEDVSVLRADQ